MNHLLDHPTDDRGPLPLHWLKPAPRCHFAPMKHACGEGQDAWFECQYCCHTKPADGL